MQEHSHGARGEQPEFVPVCVTEDPLASVRTMMRACMQCGTCTGSCVNSHAMDATPRELWRMVQMDLKDDIFNSRTFWLCSSCYTCTLRCPRGLPLTEAMAALKRIALKEGIIKDKRSPKFYRTFLDTVRRYGRVREMEMMTRYFMALKNPVVPFGFAPLGARLMIKGKVSIQMPAFSGKGKLDSIYRKVKEMEDRQ